MKQVICFLLTVGMVVTSFANEIPLQAYQYRNELIRTARYFNGLNAHVSMYAAQIQQESDWRAKARSKYAAGLAQFTPATARWISRYSPELKNGAPLNPKWAMRALVMYDSMLKKQVGGIDNCNQHAFTLSAYNGGLGWVARDRKLTVENDHNKNIWWNSVEKFSPRSKAAYQQNRHYVRVILIKYQRLYHDNGWGGPLICPPKSSIEPFPGLQT